MPGRRGRSPSRRASASVVDLANAASFEERTRLIEARRGWRGPGRPSPTRSPRRRSVWVDGRDFDESALVGKRVRILDGPDGHIEGRVTAWKGKIGRDNSKRGYEVELDNGTRLKNVALWHASCSNQSARQFEVFQAVRAAIRVPASPRVQGSVPLRLVDTN
jgi:hypothetical protein